MIIHHQRQERDTSHKLQVCLTVDKRKGDQLRNWKTEQMRMPHSKWVVSQNILMVHPDISIDKTWHLCANMSHLNWKYVNYRPKINNSRRNWTRQIMKNPTYRNNISRNLPLSKNLFSSSKKKRISRFKRIMSVD